MTQKTISCSLLAFALAGLSLAPAPLVADSGPDQAALAERLGSLADAHTIETDAQGHVVRFAVSNHQVHRPINDKTVLAQPGLTDDDLADLLQLRHLQAIFLEKQALSAAGYQQLTDLPALEDVRIHYPGDRFVNRHHGLDPIDASFATLVDRLPHTLRQLELKHGFDVQGEGGDVLAGLRPLPQLRKLELDTAFATPGSVEFILGSPELEDLQLHRTTLSDADLQRVFAALPKLRILELRPVANSGPDPIGAHSLRGLREHQNLQRLYLSIAWGELGWEDGLEHLATIPTLTLLSVAGTKPPVDPDGEAIRKLREALPDLSINFGKPEKNVTGSVPPNLSRDSETKWGITK